VVVLEADAVRVADLLGVVVLDVDLEAESDLDPVLDRDVEIVLERVREGVCDSEAVSEVVLLSLAVLVMERDSEIVRENVFVVDVLLELVLLGVLVKLGVLLSLTVDELVPDKDVEIELEGVSERVADSDTLVEGETLPVFEDSGVFDLLAEPDDENDPVNEIETD